MPVCIGRDQFCSLILLGQPHACAMLHQRLCSLMQRLFLPDGFLTSSANHIVLQDILYQIKELHFIIEAHVGQFSAYTDPVTVKEFFHLFF
jgi:hypothetical protein